MIRSVLVLFAFVAASLHPHAGQPRGSVADGSGVHVYVIDTGVRKTHREFGGRADWVGDFVGRSASPDADDCDPPHSGGHGTHVASLVGGSTYGVAPRAALHALRILPCTGTDRTDYEAAVRAAEWVTAHARRPAVVNLSPARWITTETRLDEAIRRSIATGITWVLSAGGIGDVAGSSPQRVAEAIVVAATDEKRVAARADYGPTLTLFARGIDVEAAGNRSDRAVFSGSGDSYAAPHAAGAAALYLQGHPQATPEEVKRAAVASAVRDVVQNAGNAPNRLLD